MTMVQHNNDDQFPVPNPGIEEHVERWSDADRGAGKRAYRQVVTLFGLVPVLAIINVIGYFAIPRHATVTLLGTTFFAHHLFLGLTGGLATLLIGVGAVHWARQIMNDAEIAEERHAAGSDDEQREGFLTKLNAGISDAGVSRRTMILGSLGGALGVIALPAAVMMLDIGPWPLAATRKETIEKTIWAEGVRIVNDANWKPIMAKDVELGQLINAEPETLHTEYHGAAHQVEKAKAALIVVRMDPNDIKIPESRKDWHVGGILAYSKICTHVGCPISLWEQQTHHLLCPCHQSTFDLGNSGVVVFGPAARALPQLPISVDAEGYLVAKSDFTVPVGPSYFERDSRNDYKDGDR